VATLRLFGLILRETVREWTEDKVPRLGAALAYYAGFSLAPLLIIAIVISGSIFGESNAQAQIVGEVAALVGQEAAQAVNRMVDAARLPREAGLVTTTIGVITLLFGALGVFGQLQDGFDTIWEVTPKARAGVWVMVQTRLVSFGMVLAVGFLLLASLIANAMLTAASASLRLSLPNFGWLQTVYNVILPLGVSTALFGVMFKVLPDVDIAWRDVWPGALLTGVLFTVGKNVMGFYLGAGRVGTAFGAAGSILILLFWVYYSAQILYFGAEFTQVYIHYRGQRPAVPTENAVPVTAVERQQQGIPHLGSDPAPGPSEPAPRRWWRWPRRVARVPGTPRAPGLLGALLGFLAGLGAGLIVSRRLPPGSDVK
jgi:membrane protein